MKYGNETELCNTVIGCLGVWIWFGTFKNNIIIGALLWKEGFGEKIT